MTLCSCYAIKLAYISVSFDLTYDKLSDKNTVESKVMVHNFIHNAKISRYYERIEHILQKFYEKTKIKFFDIIRCKLNLQYQVSRIWHHCA